jgi:hypothetical protein
MHQPIHGGQKAFPFSGNSLEKFFGAACKRDGRERAMAGERDTLHEDISKKTPLFSFITEKISVNSFFRCRYQLASAVQDSGILRAH